MSAAIPIGVVAAAAVCIGSITLLWIVAELCIDRWCDGRERSSGRRGGDADRRRPDSGGRG